MFGIYLDKVAARILHGPPNSNRERCRRWWVTEHTNATTNDNNRTVMSRQSSDTLPPTARAIALLLASTPTVQDAQPGVLHQLLEFSHRYTAQVLSDALVYAEHAGRSGKIEMDDVVLAVQARVGWEFGGRVPKEVRRYAVL